MINNKYWIIFLCLNQIKSVFSSSNFEIKKEQPIVGNHCHYTEFMMFQNNTLNGILIDEAKALPKGFMYVNANDTEGPITIDREKDNGTKINLHDMLHSNLNNSFYYDYENFKLLPDIIPKDPEYLCEIIINGRPEGYKGYDISCPNHYSISIDKTFFGRYKGDKTRCRINNLGVRVKKRKLRIKEKCGNDPIHIVRELCEGRQYCTILPSINFFGKVCENIYKYLHINYHCIKDKNLKKEKFSIVMFANKIEVNSHYENAISEMYQYSKIHGYHFYVSNYRYDTEREIYYMKFHVILEQMLIGLKEKKYDWIFWADSDIVIANPNIKLESFLPNDKMNKINLIISDDMNGLNNGIFLLRVHPWSLNFIIRAMAYSYFNIKKNFINPEQTSMNNVLVESEEQEHYIIVPQNWFNSYIGLYKNGDLLLHLAGKSNKNEKAKTFRDEIKSNMKLIKKNSFEMRKEVLDYYNLPKEKHHKINAI